MVEYSDGYKEKARKRVEAVDKSLTKQGRVVARSLSQHLEKSSTKPTTDHEDKAA